MARRVLVLVLAVDREPWVTVEREGQRATWAAHDVNGVETLWLHGINRGPLRFGLRAGAKVLEVTGATSLLQSFRRASGRWQAARPVQRIGDRVETAVAEGYLTTTAKTLAGLRHVLETSSFDYLLRTNTSTYVHLPGLLRFVARLPNTGYYGGFTGEVKGVKFASGTCILMSRDVVALAAQDAAFDFHLIDDVAIGRSMARNGVSLRHFDRLDLTSTGDLERLEASLLRNVFVVRCKGRETRDHDVTAMHYVHKLYANETHSPSLRESAHVANLRRLAAAEERLDEET